MQAAQKSYSIMIAALCVPPGLSETSYRSGTGFFLGAGWAKNKGWCYLGSCSLQALDVFLSGILPELLSMPSAQTESAFLTDYYRFQF